VYEQKFIKLRAELLQETVYTFLGQIETFITWQTKQCDLSCQCTA